MSDFPAINALLFGLRDCLVDSTTVQLTPGALQTLDGLKQQHIPCAWIDELTEADALQLSSPLPSWLKAQYQTPTPWPAPDACWHALMSLKAPGLEGCVLVSGDPRLLQSGLNAGLWTVGVATCTSRCRADSLKWQALSLQEQERERGKATLQLFALGVHSVIGHLEALGDCLNDIAQRRIKGEKP
ncbi:phosphonoacetaldehyde phosphonohydrolase-related protein [Pseudomonas sp. V1]|uniref:phosphonoacetaldehyde phosphonohydrolase-related protein n=1 Tax=Pseudomonas arcuscaelestis TaxID=2710591 RepID=UPI00194012F1|nr:phosphonoacetaldehyde phosphonohydrolase-related protein [Pseudomonas arcuscaelestis]MBM3106986.1 phosphonoacetaldehyde phosphonohydrolase-related protein [Pseudomonas arcuscaelestis]